MDSEQFLKRYMSEYIGRLSYSLCQFWTVDEQLPDEDEREAEIFYKVSIARLTDGERGRLVRALLNKADPMAGYFDREFCESRGAVQRILGIIERFPLLKEALQTEELILLRQHNFVA